MTKSDVGEFLMQSGVVLMFLPILLLAGIFLIALISTIHFTFTTLLVIGTLIYYAVAIFLIVYGKKMQD